jgi:hypothetical protein
MALPSLTLRNVKGSPITFAEMDTNLTNLQQADFNVSVGASVSPIRFDSTLTFTGGAGISIALNTSTRTVTLGVTTATTSTVGGIKVGANLTITEDGTLSATASGSGFTGTVAVLTATQAVVIDGIILTRVNGNLIATYSTSTTTTTSGGVASTATLFQARLENNFTDDANTGTTAVNNGTVAWTTSSRFGTHSLDFGQDASQTTKNIAFSNTKSMNFGTGNFTIEAWVFCAERNIQAPNYYHKIVQTTSGGKWLAFTDSNDSENFGFFFGDDNNSVYLGSAAVDVIHSQWNHLVFMRSGSNLIMGINGNLQTVSTGYTSQTVDWTDLKIGGNQSVGFIDSVKISSGVIYPTSGTYTVPTADFAVVSTSTTVVTTSSALSYLSGGGVTTGKAIAMTMIFS